MRPGSHGGCPEDTAPCGVPGTQQGRGEDSWALPDAAAQLKEGIGFSPQTWHGEDRLEVPGGVAQLQGPHALILPLLSISHREPEGTIPPGILQ